MKYFVDSWAWVELANERALRHAEVETWFASLDIDQDILVTTDYILDEVISLVFKRKPALHAQNFLAYLDLLIDERHLVLERIHEARFNAARKLRLKYLDKPDISFTDLTSMTLMLELGITYIVTSDAHFLKVGAGFQLLP
jgi:uncharacterized protein